MRRRAQKEARQRKAHELTEKKSEWLSEDLGGVSWWSTKIELQTVYIYGEKALKEQDEMAFFGGIHQYYKYLYSN